MMQSAERRFVGAVLFWGAVLAMLGNALHPFFPLRIEPEEFLAGVEQASTIWGLVHISLVASAVLLGTGLVMVAQRLAGTAGDALARVAVVMTLIGVVLFVFWQGVLDGLVFPALADEFATSAEAAAVLATTAGMLAVENGLAAVSVLLFLGVGFLAFGLAIRRARAFGSWIQWTLIVSGGAGTVVGTMMFVGAGDGLTFWVFRVVGLAETIALFGLAVQLYRGVALVHEPAATAAS